MSAERIAEIEADHPNEWLAIEVTETDRQGQPLRGSLIAHSHNHGEVIQAVSGRSGFIMVVYSGEPECEVVLCDSLPIQS